MGQASSPPLSISDIYRAVYKERGIFFLANGLAIIATLVSLPVPLLMPLLIDEVLLKKEGVLTEVLSPLFEGVEPIAYIITVLVSVVLLRILHWATHVVQFSFFTRIAKRVIFRFRKRLILEVGQSSAASLETLDRGSVNALLVNDLNTLDQFISTSIGRFLVSALSLIGVSIVLAKIHIGLAVFIIVLNPLIIFLSQRLARRVGSLKKEENAAIETFQSRITEWLDLLNHIRVNNRMEYFMDRSIEGAEQVRDTAIAFGYKSEAASRFSFTIFLLGFEVFRAVSIAMVAFSDLSIGLMFAVFGYLWYMMTPIQDILSMQYSYHGARQAILRINRLLTLRKEPVYTHESNPFASPDPVSIRLEEVSFAYTPEKPILQSVNMTIPPASKVALVGASGSGKTTLANLIVGLYPIDKGMIYYNDEPLTAVGYPCIRKHVFLLLQQPQLFNDTLRYNMTLGESYPDERIYEVLEQACLGDMVNSWEAGLDTRVGVQGTRLSGGQRQRLAIARMLLVNPKVVIFDESTSALDLDTEHKIYDTLHPLLADKTCLIIAHRPTTIERADFVYQLEDGGVRVHEK